MSYTSDAVIRYRQLCENVEQELRRFEEMANAMGLEVRRTHFNPGRVSTELYVVFVGTALMCAISVLNSDMACDGCQVRCLTVDNAWANEPCPEFVTVAEGLAYVKERGHNFPEIYNKPT